MSMSSVTGSPLGGRSATIFNDANNLMALRTHDEGDWTDKSSPILSSFSFVINFILVSFINGVIYHQQIRRTDISLAYVSERRLRIVVTVLNVVLAAVLLFGAILNLYCVTDEQR